MKKKLVIVAFSLVVAALSITLTHAQQNSDYTASAKTFHTPIGYYDYYEWRKSIKTWAIDDSLKHTDNQILMAKSSMKYFILHFTSVAL